jgi:hypothetical protein
MRKRHFRDELKAREDIDEKPTRTATLSVDVNRIASYNIITQHIVG